METRPHHPAGPHPWEVIGMALPLRPLPTPIPVMREIKMDFPRPANVHAGLPPAGRIIMERMLPNPQSGTHNARQC